MHHGKKLNFYFFPKTKLRNIKNLSPSPLSKEYLCIFCCPFSFLNIIVVSQSIRFMIFVDLYQLNLVYCKLGMFLFANLY